MNGLSVSLRRVAEVLESHSMDLYSVSVRNDGDVHLIESDFRKLFKGLQFTGQRAGKWVKVKAELDGLTFCSELYSARAEEECEELICV